MILGIPLAYINTFFSILMMSLEAFKTLCYLDLSILAKIVSSLTIWHKLRYTGI